MPKRVNEDSAPAAPVPASASPVPPSTEAPSQGQSLVSSVLSASLSPIMAIAIVLFAAGSTASVTLLAYSEMSAGTYQAPLATTQTHSKVLGLATYGYNQPVCGYNTANCLNYQLIGYSGTGWQVRIDYQLEANLVGKILINNKAFADNLTGSGSWYTGYDLVPGKTYNFVLYKKVSKYVYKLTSLSLTAPSAPSPQPSYGYTIVPIPQTKGSWTEGWIERASISNYANAPANVTVSGWAYNGGAAINLSMALVNTDNGAKYLPSGSLIGSSFRADISSYLTSKIGQSPSGQGGNFSVNFDNLPAGHYIIYGATYNGNLFNVHNQALATIVISNAPTYGYTSSVNVSMDPSSPVSRQASMGSNEVILGTYKFTETSGKSSATLTGASFVASAITSGKTISGTTDPSQTFYNYSLWANGAKIGSIVTSALSGGQNLGPNQYLVPFDNLNLTIPAYSNVILTLKANIKTFASGAASGSMWQFGLGIGSALAFNGSVNVFIASSTNSNPLLVLRTSVGFSSVGSISVPLSANVNATGNPSPGEVMGIFAMSVGSAGDATLNSLTFQQSGTALPSMAVNYSVYDASVSLVSPVGTFSLTNSGSGIVSAVNLNLNSALAGNGVMVTAGQVKYFVVTANTTGFVSGYYGLTLNDWRWSDGTTNTNQSLDSGTVTAITSSNAGRTYLVPTSTNHSPSAPILSLGPTGSIIVNMDQQFNFLSTDSDGDNLNFTINWGDGSPAVSLPGQNGIYGTTVGALHTWTVLGNYNVTVTVSDGKGGAATTTFNFNVANRVNLAAAANGGVAVPSAENAPQYPSSSVINGDRTAVNYGSGTGGWEDTNSTYPDWMEVRFTAPKTINEIDVYTVANNYQTTSNITASTMADIWGIMDFQVQYENGSGWQTVNGGNITGNMMAWRQFNSFGAIGNVYKIRVYVTNARVGRTRIAEIEVY